MLKKIVSYVINRLPVKWEVVGCLHVASIHGVNIASIHSDKLSLDICSYIGRDINFKIDLRLDDAKLLVEAKAKKGLIKIICG